MKAKKFVLIYFKRQNNQLVAKTIRQNKVNSTRGYHATTKKITATKQTQKIHWSWLYVDNFKAFVLCVRVVAFCDLRSGASYRISLQ